MPLSRRTPPLKHQNAIGTFDSGQAMGDDERGAAGEELIERDLDQAFGLAIDAGGRLVHHEDARVVGERAGEREQLALASGEIGAALVNLLMEAAGQPLDEFASPGRG